MSNAPTLIEQAVETGAPAMASWTGKLHDYLDSVSDRAIVVDNTITFSGDKPRCWFVTLTGFPSPN